MSKVAIQGNASGTGTFTIAAPNSNTDRTLTLPDEAGTVLTSGSDIAATGTNVIQNSGPLFYAYSNTGNPYEVFTNNVHTKVMLNTVEFQEDTTFDTTNYRFLPNVAGYYLINASAYSSWQTIQYSNFVTQIYKNGSLWIRTNNICTTSVYNYGDITVSGLVYLNGSTDYVELYVQSNGGTDPVYFSSSPYHTWMTGHLVRKA